MGRGDLQPYEARRRKSYGGAVYLRPSPIEVVRVDQLVYHNAADVQPDGEYGLYHLEYGSEVNDAMVAGNLTVDVEE